MKSTESSNKATLVWDFFFIQPKTDLFRVPPSFCLPFPLPTIITSRCLMFLLKLLDPCLYWRSLEIIWQFTYFASTANRECSYSVHRYSFEQSAQQIRNSSTVSYNSLISNYRVLFWRYNGIFIWDRMIYDVNSFQISRYSMST